MRTQCAYSQLRAKRPAGRTLQIMKPPICCPRCDKEIPGKEEISSIRDLLKECGIFLKQGDGERAREALESLQYVCLFPLYGEGCATVSRASQSEDDDLTSDIDKLFEGLVARSGRDASLVRLQLLNYDKHRVFEALESHNTPEPIPSWGLDSSSVLELLRYLDPYSEDLRTKKRLLCVYDAISEQWWRRPVPADSPLREIDTADVEKLMFAIREKGNEVLYFEPPPGGPCWLLKRDASDKIDHRFKKHVNLNLSDKTRRQAIGYLVAPMPAPRLLEEEPFIRIVKMVLRLWHPEIASAKNPITDNVIRKAIRLIGLQNLKKISQIPKNAIREYCFTNPSSLAINPDEVAFFLGKHPDMRLTNYDNEIRALLDGLDPEALAALWLQADSYIRNQMTDAFEKSDLRCSHCDRPLPNKEERRWVDLTREWVGQWDLFELYAREKPFCLCPEKDLESSDNERAQWRRRRAKLLAAVVLKYPNLDGDPKHARNARFLLKTMTDLMNGKRLRDETDGTLKKALRRFIEFGNEWLYNKKLHVPGHGEICVADMIDTPLFSRLLGPHSFDEDRGALGELLKMSRVLGQFLDPSQAKILYDSQYPIPRQEYDPDVEVWRRMADDDFNGDPWADDEIDYDFSFDYEPLSILGAYDPGARPEPDPEVEREFQASEELRDILRNGGANLRTMQKLEIMSYDELEAKVREDLKARLKAIGGRIALLLLGAS